MSTTSGSSSTHTSDPKPGLGWPAKAAAVVFVVGLIVIGILYLAGEPVDTLADAPQIASPPTTQPQTPATTPAAPTDTGERYLTPDGRSPLPKPGEGIAPAIPAERLATQEEYEAMPPQMSDLPVPDEPVPWTDAHKHLGQIITVKGTIVDTNNIGQLCFLNYDPDWQDKFYIAMFSDAFELLPDPPEKHYLNKTLLVTGKVTLHKDRPQIEVRDVSQIEVLE